eukprot:g32323.t1
MTEQVCRHSTTALLEDRVLLLSLDEMELLRELPMEGSASGVTKLGMPNDVVADAAGNLLVMDTRNERVAVFRQDGTFIASIMEGFFKDKGNTFSYLACNVETGVVALSNNDMHELALLSTDPARLWLAENHSAQKLAAEMIESGMDLALLGREDLRELGLSMVEASKVLNWSQVVRSRPLPPEQNLVRLSSDLPLSPWHGAKVKTAKSTPSMSPWAEVEVQAEEQRLDEIEGQVDFWVSCFASGLQCTPMLSTGLESLQEDVRENILEAFFDCTPESWRIFFCSVERQAEERVREVFVSMDTDNDGHVSVEELRVGLQRCGISGFDNQTLATVFEHVTGAGRRRALHLQAFETILCRLRLASLLTRPWKPKSLSVMDFNASKVSDAEVTSDNMCQFFFGHRLCSDRLAVLPAGDVLVRWVHMASFDLNLLFALTVKYTLHPLSVEDVIEQCQTKIDRLGGHYFLTIELLTLVDGGLSKGRQPVRVRGQHVAAFCSGPPQLDTLITVAQADRKFTEDWPGGAPQVEVTAGWLPRLQQRLHAARSRLRERRADALLYALVDLCADELDLRIRGDRSLLDLGEVSLAQLQLAIVARRLRSLQRVVRRASEYQDLHTTGSADYWRDCA